jgi:hypothetical protein
MLDVLKKMMPDPLPSTTSGMIRSVRETIQTLALLGLWRARFFEHASFYGGTALRILYGLDRFSEDLDFSLLKSSGSFDFTAYAAALEREINAFGFNVRFETKMKQAKTPVESAFLKGNTLTQLITVNAPDHILKEISRDAVVKIKLEIDTQPPGGFNTEMKYVFSPVQYSVRTFTLPSLFAGKIHALLCRKWRTRVKGRDWYDFSWYAAHHPVLNIVHLEERMRQSGHYTGPEPLTRSALITMIVNTIDSVDLDSAIREVTPFIEDPRSLEIWSKDYFKAAAERIVVEAG